MATKVAFNKLADDCENLLIDAEEMFFECVLLSIIKTKTKDKCLEGEKRLAD
jgi:hypothetical protein